VLLDLLVNEKFHKNLKKIVVASSMSIYGEGAYECPTCGRFYPGLRCDQQLGEHRWEVVCPTCQAEARPLPTAEDKPLAPTSIYAITKRDHEEMFLCVGRACLVPTVALRYFNIYGPRQAVTNPYTGVAAIFAGQLLAGENPLVFEDGTQRRDFVHVRDIVAANLLAMDRSEADFEVFNIGSGTPVTILEVAETLIGYLRPEARATILGRFRVGDIRHCFADISKAKARLGYRPTVTFEEGMKDLIAWAADQRVGDNHGQRTARMVQELNAHGLTR
jgi:dTDP-L-rhamnose 4-epimerase